MSTDYTKRFHFWRLTFSVSLPIWMKFVTQWVCHPIQSLLERQRAKRQAALEAKWEKLFSTAFNNRPAPEFEMDEKHPGRVVGLKETPQEQKLPSVGVWSSSDDKGSLDRAIHSHGVDVKWGASADEETVEKRREALDKIYYDLATQKRSKKK